MPDKRGLSFCFNAAGNLLGLRLSLSRKVMSHQSSTPATFWQQDMQRTWEQPGESRPGKNCLKHVPLCSFGRCIKNETATHELLTNGSLVHENGSLPTSSRAPSPIETRDRCRVTEVIVHTEAGQNLFYRNLSMVAAS